MKYFIALLVVIIPSFAVAQGHAFVGYKYVPGDTAWFKTQLVSTNSIKVTSEISGQQKVTNTGTHIEQTVYHHQTAISHDDSLTVLETVYDSLRLKFGGDSLLIDYNSTNPADSLAAYNMMVYPLKSLIAHPLLVYIGGSGKIDSVKGLDKAVADASLQLNRSAQIQALKNALNEEMFKDLLQQSLGNLPNKDMGVNTSEKYTKARMVGLTQFIDNVVSTLVQATADSAWLLRVTYTRIASPTITYGGERCIVDSTAGSGDERMTLDLKHGVVATSHNEVNSYVRAGVSGTNTSLVQTSALIADATLMKYAEKSSGKKDTKRKK